jgi:hypothetical protein
MELKDTFTNKYFKSDNFKSQMDLINQPTEVDAYADAFSGQANREAKGPAQRNSNALMAGLGAGLKGAANTKRQEQLSPILKMVGELNARSAYLEAQMQQEEQQKMTMVKFLRDNKRAIRDLGNASVANSPETQEISKHLSNKFEMLTGKAPGQFDYYDTQRRKTHYRQADGSTIGYGFLDVVEPYAEAAYGEETTDILQNLSPYHNKKYSEAEEKRQILMDEKRANIDNTKAHTGLYEAQAGKTTQEMNKQPEVISPERAETQQTIELQKDAIKEIYKSRVNDSFYRSSMKTAEDVIKKAQKNSAKYERNMFNRAFDKEGEITRLNKEQERLHTVGTEIKGVMFRRFGYRNQAEFENLPDISPNKTVQQNKSALEIIQKTYKEMVENEGNAISDFNNLVRSQSMPEGSSYPSTDQNTPQAVEFVQDENGTIYRVED